MNLAFSLARTRIFKRGCKGKHYFLTSKLFRKNFQKSLQERKPLQSSKELTASSATRFSNGSAKVRLFN